MSRRLSRPVYTDDLIAAIGQSDDSRVYSESLTPETDIESTENHAAMSLFSALRELKEMTAIVRRQDALL